MKTEDPIYQAMSAASRKPDGPLSPALDQGYTYFGQFLSHELVPPTNPAIALRFAGRTFNGRLEADSLYGPFIGSPDERFVNSSGLFQLINAGGIVDIPRDGDVAAIPEIRNDENTLVSQFHLLFLRVHNRLLEKKIAADFTAARKLVTLLIQLLTIEDYLCQLLTPEVFKHYFRDNGEPILNLQHKSVKPKNQSNRLRHCFEEIRSSPKSLKFTGPLSLVIKTHPPGSRSVLKGAMPSTLRYKVR